MARKQPRNPHSVTTPRGEARVRPSGTKDELKGQPFGLNTNARRLAKRLSK